MHVYKGSYRNSFLQGGIIWSLESREWRAILFRESLTPLTLVILSSRG